MAIEYTWFVIGLHTKKVGDKADVVHKIDWKLIGRETTPDGTLVADYFGNTDLEIGDLSESFTDFDALTQEQVSGWIEGIMGEEKVESFKRTIALTIEETKARNALVVKPAPWLRIPESELPPAPPIPQSE